MAKNKKRRTEQQKYRAETAKRLREAQKESDVGFAPIEPAGSVAEKLKRLPKKPGVYLWKDHRGTVIYVGKAKVLFNRVRSYFQNFHGKDIKTRLLVAGIKDLDWIVTDTEKEALILENNLIKKYRPRYNIRLRDDKNFLNLRLSTNETFPRLSLVRKIKKDGATYFGPFSNAKAARTTLRFINKHFPIRKCNNRKFSGRTRPCLNYQIGLCEGACSGKITPELYGKIVRRIKLFFAGEATMLTGEMQEEMERASESLHFERAARLRDAISAIRATVERQKMVSDDFTPRDVLGLYREGGSAIISILFIRNGSILGHRAVPITNMELPDGEIFASVIKQYYSEGNLIPKEILVGADLNDEKQVIRTWLSEEAGVKVEILQPKRGRKRELLKLAMDNAASQFEISRTRLLDVDRILERIRKRLKLANFPRRIECFDVSNLQGTNQVASQVCFVDGEPEKSGYRLYKVKTVKGQDDYSSMHEVLSRRFAKSRDENPWPDLLMIDGGKGQLNIATAVLIELKVAGLDVVAFTKIRDAGRDEPEDMAYLPGRKNPVTFKKGGDDLFLLQRIRDESHRFAIEYHRKLRSKDQRKSVLDGIPGVGTARKKALLKHFGSVKRLSKATAAQIVEVKGIPKSLAETIRIAMGNGNDNG